jgi:hypothetical protein
MLVNDADAKILVFHVCENVYCSPLGYATAQFVR